MPKKKTKTTGASSSPAAPAPPAPDKECFICHQDFATQVDCDQHVQDIHGPRFDCQCAHCTGKRRHDSAKLAEEVKLQDDGKEIKTFRCIVCKYQVFLLCKCLSHIQTAHNTVSLQKQYECMKCNVGFEKCIELHNHILAEHPLAQKIARCGFSHCKKCFSNAQLLQSHLKQNHKVTKPFELLNTIKGGGTPHTINTTSASSSVKKTSTDNASSSAWSAPDPTSEDEEQKMSPEKPDPELTCKICSKTHKSQTSYNNHMLVFHKEKAKSKPAPKRRRCDDDDDADDDVTSEDSDWEPSNSRAKRTSTRSTKALAKKPSSSGEKKLVGKNEPGGNGGKKRAEDAAAGSEGSTSDTAHNNEPSDSLQHNSHDSHAKEDDCSNCMACKQANKMASLPAVRIKQEPIDPDDIVSNPTMPVISNVFSMNGHAEHGYDNHSNDQDRSPSVGSNYSSVSTALANTDHGNNGYNMITGSPPSNPTTSTGWQQQMPVANGNTDLCSNCLSQKPDENKCVHCGIIFMDAPMHMIHMLWHGEKHPFQCHSCGKLCKDKYSFTTHIFKAQHL